jgi:hypothetical protein
MKTVVITRHSYTTRGRAFGAARRMVTLRDNHVFVGPRSVHVEWTLDNVVVEEAEDGWRWHVEIDMPDTEDAMAEVEAQERLDMEDEAYFERIASTEEAPRETEKRHPLLTDEAIQACADKTRKAISDASGLLISLHGRAERRFNGGVTEDELQALVELSALANMAIAMLSRFDNSAAPKLDKALAQNS